MIEGKRTNEEQFIAWLATKVSPAQLSELYLCYPEIEEYCLKFKILHKPLFETTDLDTIKKVQQYIEQSKMFKYAHKKQIKKIRSAAKYYRAFLEELGVSDVVTSGNGAQEIIEVKEQPESIIEETASVKTASGASMKTNNEVSKAIVGQKTASKKH